MKLVWAREDYVMCCSRKDRSGIARLRQVSGNWKDEEGITERKIPPYVMRRKTLYIFY
jgi:hypothetical protein